MSQVGEAKQPVVVPPANPMAINSLPKKQRALVEAAHRAAEPVSPPQPMITAADKRRAAIKNKMLATVEGVLDELTSQELEQKLDVGKRRALFFEYLKQYAGKDPVRLNLADKIVQLEIEIGKLEEEKNGDVTPKERIELEKLLAMKTKYSERLQERLGVGQEQTENEITLSAVYERYREEIERFKVGEVRPDVAKQMRAGDSDDTVFDPETYKIPGALTDEQRKLIEGSVGKSDAE
jgi:hypothetical protein